MVWVALLYAVGGTYITFKIGRPLIKLNYQQEVVEANFRFGLMRVREYGENIAFYNGEQQEKTNLSNKFNEVVNNFIAIVFRQMKLDIFNISYSQIAIIFPMLVSAPRYFAKLIKLGDLMQISSAFGHVQGAFSFFMGAYGSLAGWRAVMDRLLGFNQALLTAVGYTGLPKEDSPQSYLEVRDLKISLPEQDNPFLSGIYLNLAGGDRLLVKGASGCGKTTFLRSLAGLWPFVSGQILQDKHRTELFVAQRPYMPQASLRVAICYPLQENLPSDSEISAILDSCALGYLSTALDEARDWSKILSLGEQQRIAFARILVNRPDIIYLDEASSALDEAMEQRLYHLLINSLPHSAIISIGHRSTLQQWHNQELNFNQFSRELQSA